MISRTQPPSIVGTPLVCVLRDCASTARVPAPTCGDASCGRCRPPRGFPPLTCGDASCMLVRPPRGFPPLTCGDASRVLVRPPRGFPPLTCGDASCGIVRPPRGFPPLTCGDASCGRCCPARGFPLALCRDASCGIVRPPCGFPLAPCGDASCGRCRPTCGYASCALCLSADCSPASPDANGAIASIAAMCDRRGWPAPDFWQNPSGRCPALSTRGTCGTAPRAEAGPRSECGLLSDLQHVPLDIQSHWYVPLDVIS